LAVYTSLELEEASSITRAHELGDTEAIIPIAAGSVNSNYFVEGAFGRVFLRIYEEQERAGVEYEWALLKHLAERGVPLPRILPGPEPGELTIAGKPVALFELVRGEEYCQKMITPARAASVGAALAKVHLAGRDFPIRKPSRFGRPELRERLAIAEAAERPELKAVLEEQLRLLDEFDKRPPLELPSGIIHGDLFRDNVKYQVYVRLDNGKEMTIETNTNIKKIKPVYSNGQKLLITKDHYIINLSNVDKIKQKSI